MKNLTFLIVFLLLGCVSFTPESQEPSRDPASIKRNHFSFNLFGQNPLTTGPYKFELVNLDQLSHKQVQFRSFEMTDPTAESSIHAWHLDLQALRSKYEGSNDKVIFKFDFQKIFVLVEKSDLKNIDHALEALDETESDANLRLRKKIEIVTSFNERFKESMDQNIEILTLPLEALGRLSTQRIQKTDGQIPQIYPSSFWTPRRSVDLTKGPGTIDPAQLNQEICTYAGPKSGFGVHAGFKINCLGTKLKVKFGNEVYSGPLNSRLYHRLGYNVPALHYVPALKVRYQREILSEINSRKKKAWHIQAAHQTVKDVERLKIYDAADFVTWVHLKDGRTVVKGGSELKNRLLRSGSCTQQACEYSDRTVNTEFESQIAYLEFQPTSVAEPIGDELGAWSYNLLDHPQRTEVKALVVLGAWTGNFDLRKDNTNLIALPNGELKHFISDPGSGLGMSKGIFRTGSRVDDLTWQSTIETFTQDSDQPRTNYVGLNYKPIEENEAFRKVSYQDGQWMAQQIAEVSEDEISEALAASGLSAAEFLLAREKLISNQLGIIKHFGLKEKYPHRFLREINNLIPFDSAQHGATYDVQLSNGKTLRLETRGINLMNGRLIYPEGQRPKGL